MVLEKSQNIERRSGIRTHSNWYVHAQSVVNQQFYGRGIESATKFFEKNFHLNSISIIY